MLAEVAIVVVVVVVVVGTVVDDGVVVAGARGPACSLLPHAAAMTSATRATSTRTTPWWPTTLVTCRAREKPVVAPAPPAAARQWHDRAVTDTWAQTVAEQVRVGDRVRMAGHEVLVSSIEPSFMGIDTMIAFIEDTPDRWFKMPVPKTAAVDVQRPA